MIEIYKDPLSDSICIVRYTDDNEDPDDMHVLPWHGAELDVVYSVPEGDWIPLTIPVLPSVPGFNQPGPR